MFAAIAAIAALFGVWSGLSVLDAAESLGSCKVCRDYNRACLQAHSKQACKSELEMCLKHCSPEEIVGRQKIQPDDINKETLQTSFLDRGRNWLRSVSCHSFGFRS